MRTTRRMAAPLLPLALALIAPAAARAEDTSPPEIQHTPITAAERGRAVSIRARITDESKFFPQVFYRWDGSASYEKPIDMKAMKGKKNRHWFEAQVPAKGRQTLEYYIEAYDEFGNGPARAGTPEAPNKVEIAAAAVAEQKPAEKPAEEKPAEVAAEPPRAEEKPAEAAAEPPAAEEKPAEPPPRAKEKPPVLAEKTIPAAEPVIEPSAPSSSGGRAPGGGRMWTWIVGGTGVGMLLGGVLSGLAFKKADDAYSARQKETGTNNPASLQQQYDATKSIGTMSTIMLIGGVALVGGGVALYFLENPEKGSGKRADAEQPDKRLQFAAAPVQGGAAAVVAGKF